MQAENEILQDKAYRCRGSKLMGEDWVVPAVWAGVLQLRSHLTSEGTGAKSKTAESLVAPASVMAAAGSPNN